MVLHEIYLNIFFPLTEVFASEHKILIAIIHVNMNTMGFLKLFHT